MLYRFLATFLCFVGSHIVVSQEIVEDSGTAPSISEEQHSLEHVLTVAGVTDTEILFGQSCALSGLNGASGQGMQVGIQAAFNEINNADGVHGRTLKLITLDDRYEPELTIENTNQLIDTHNVFSLIGAVGTPTSRVAVDIAQNNSVPYIGPLTGAAFLRQEQEVVINLRASYAQETEAMIEFLTKEVGTTRIATFYQDDSYGRAGHNGAKAAMERRGLKLLPSGVYRRNSIDVRKAVLDVMGGEPEAVVMIGAYEPSAEFILWSRKVGLDTIFINISFVNSNALANALGEDGTGVMVSQVVPFPKSDSLEIARQYRNSLAVLDGDLEPGFFSFEGYLVGRLAILGLERAGPELTREGFLDAIRSINDVDLDGFLLDFKTDNQGSDRVFMTMLTEAGTFRAVETIEDLSR